MKFKEYLEESSNTISEGITDFFFQFVKEKTVAEQLTKMVDEKLAEINKETSGQTDPTVKLGMQKIKDRHLRDLKISLRDKESLLKTKPGLKKTFTMLYKKIEEL